MRVVFLGNAPASVASLERLERSTHDIALVVTRAPRPAGRGGRPRATPVAEAARRLGLPLAEVETVKDGPGFEAIRDARPDVLVVVAYGEIIRRAVLDLPRIAPVNVHFSLLPRLRGADPVRRAIRDGLDTTGVTTMRMDEGLDTGPVLLQREAPILPDDDAGALGERLSRLGAELLVDTLDALERGEITERPQDDTLATRAPKLRADDEWIDWRDDAAAIVRQVRALSPDPGAKARVAGRTLKILSARDADAMAAPGVVAEPPRERLLVGAGRGAVALERVVPEGRRPMTGVEYARGRRLRAGDPLD